MITGKHGVSATRRRYLPMALDEAQIEWVWLKSVGRPTSAGRFPLIRAAFDPNHILNPGKICPWWRRSAQPGLYQQSVIPTDIEVLSGRKGDYFFLCLRCQRVFFIILRCLCLDIFFLRHLRAPAIKTPPEFLDPQ